MQVSNVKVYLKEQDGCIQGTAPLNRNGELVDLLIEVGGCRFIEIDLHSDKGTALIPYESVSYITVIHPSTVQSPRGKGLRR